MKRKLLLLVCVWCLLPLMAQTKWINPLEKGENMVHGRWWNSELKDSYHRLTPRAEGTVRDVVWTLSKQSAGLSICFHTNAPSVKVRYKVSRGLSMFHMPSTGVSGLDLFAKDADGQLRWCASRFNLSFKDTINYEFKDITYFTGEGRGYDFELFLPLYNEVTWLEVGVPEECELRFLPASLEPPIVVYGTSVAQGACASRPGMAWTNIVHRETDYPVINLGFSGNGLLEEEVFNLMAEIDAKLYILDCLPNLATERTELIYDRMLRGVALLREKSDVPILLIEHCYSNGSASQQAVDWYMNSNLEQRRAYHTLLEQGVKNLYYLPYDEMGFTIDFMVEGCHPNDLGMRQYADALNRKIHEIFPEAGMGDKTFWPRTQQRDWYDWRTRHELMLQRNRDEQPDIVLLGNSITHFWTDVVRKDAKQAKAYAKSWNKLFKGYVVHNQGFGWDRIENGLWRIAHGELDGFEAKKVFLLLGTNNIGVNSDEEIVEGMMMLIDAVQRHQPKAKIYQVGIMPRRGAEERVAAINARVAERLKGTDVTYVDMSAGFLDGDGRLIESLFVGDGLHPNEQGYAVEAKNLEPYVKE